MILDDHETSVSFSQSFFPQPRWLSVDRGSLKWKEVFAFWERSHSQSATWCWGQEDYHCYRTLTSELVGRCDILLQRQISYRRSNSAHWSAFGTRFSPAAWVYNRLIVFSSPMVVFSRGQNCHSVTVFVGGREVLLLGFRTHFYALGQVFGHFWCFFRGYSHSNSFFFFSTLEVCFLLKIGTV